MKRGGYFYIMSNKTRSVLYIGVTSSLYWRALQHKNQEGSTFTKKYNCTDLVYYGFFESIEEAIKREKVLKKWKRTYKDELIKKLNPNLKDLTSEVEDYI